MLEIDNKISADMLLFKSEPYIEKSRIKDLLLISRPYYPDLRGSFQETFRIRDIEKIIGGEVIIRQSSVSEMLPGTIKGIHCERQHKILSPIGGEFLFVEVDLRPESATFKQWTMIKINNQQERRVNLFVPAGVGNSMCILQPATGRETAILSYAVSAEYDPQEAKRVVRYDDPQLAIPWPIKDPVVSQRDLNGYSLEDYLKKYLK